MKDLLLRKYDLSDLWSDDRILVFWPWRERKNRLDNTPKWVVGERNFTFSQFKRFVVGSDCKSRLKLLHIDDLLLHNSTKDLRKHSLNLHDNRIIVALPAFYQIGQELPDPFCSEMQDVACHTWSILFEMFGDQFKQYFSDAKRLFNAWDVTSAQTTQQGSEWLVIIMDQDRKMDHNSGNSYDPGYLRVTNTFLTEERTKSRL